MAYPILRLWEDILPNGASVALFPLPRMIFVAHGALTVGDRSLRDSETWHGEGEFAARAGECGVSLWRWELTSALTTPAPAPGVSSREKLIAELQTMPDGELLFRGDSVAFPPGGCAYLHRHQGPGIRCLLEGGLRVDTHGASTSYGPGGAWYESGPDPVFAQAAPDRASRFIRAMILPRALLGKSSIQYVNDADKNKPRVQQYKIFADFPIVRPTA
jgi:hypothetical protein